MGQSQFFHDPSRRLQVDTVLIRRYTLLQWYLIIKMMNRMVPFHPAKYGRDIFDLTTLGEIEKKVAIKEKRLELDEKRILIEEKKVEVDVKNAINKEQENALMRDMW
eukprot:NODE_192_length_13323_cov_0.206216.p5 type:complete len:107 gc:universal NODE_192_length_13323_cov_0.206216:4925-4605(-)